MNYATKIKTAMASALCVMVGMAFAGTTVTNDVQTYGATFEASEAADNDFAYVAGQKIANYTNELGTAGWFAGSEDDESVISNRTAAVEGLGSQYLLLNTDAETLTNKLSSAVADGVNTAMAGGTRTDASLYNGNVATYEGAVFESDVKFVASDTLGAGIEGGTDATKFAIYAYCNEDAEPATTNIVVFHSYFKENVEEGESPYAYTNEVFRNVSIDTTDYTHLRVEMKVVSDEFGEYNVFSVTVGKGDAAVTLSSDLSFEATSSFEDDVTSGIWFLTTEDTIGDNENKRVSSLNFKGTGEIDNIKVSQKVKETYAAIVGGIKYASWSTAIAAATNTDNVVTSYEAGALTLAAGSYVTIAGIQPASTNTASGYRVDTESVNDAVKFTSVLAKATVIFLAYDGTELERKDVTIGQVPTYTGASTDRAADADGVYTFTGWTANETLYPGALPAVVEGGVTYTATYSSVASAASVNGTYYATLAEAITAANGNPVKLNANIALSSTLIITEDLEIDLNGHDITATDCRAIWVKSGNVLITGEGTVSANGSNLGATSSVIRIGDSAANASIAALTVNTNVTVSSATCYGVTVFGKNNDGDDATTDITFDLYGTVAVSAPYVAHGCDAAISGNGNSGNSAVDITIHDGAVVTSDNANGIYFPSAGTLAIEGGTITGATAVYAKAGNIDISGGTLVATGTKAAYAATGDGANPTGDAIVIDNCGYPSGLSLDVAVTGGDVSSANGDPIGSFATGSGHEPKDGFVSGGTFNAPLADALCADGFIPVTEPNDDGKYEVTPGGTVTFVNYDGTELYKTNVANGGTAVYEDATPVKPADASGVYTFTGWDPATIAVMNSADQTYTAQFTSTAPKATVISVAGTVTNYYPTLAAAVAAAEDGDTVVLLADMTESSTLVIPANTAITLDLGGKTLTSTASPEAIFNYGTLVLQGGTINASASLVRNLGSVTVESGTYTANGNGIMCGIADKSVAAPTATGCSVTINGGTITSVEMAICTGRTAGGRVAVNGGTLTSTDNAVIGDNGTAGCGGNVFSVSNATLNASITSAGYVACGIYLANDDTLTIGDTTINVNGGAGIVARAGNATIGDGTIINTTGTAVGKVGDSRVVVPCAAVVFDSAANYPGYQTGNADLAIKGGTFVSAGTNAVVLVGTDDTVIGIDPTGTAIFSDASSDGVPEGYTLVEVEGSDPVMYQVSAAAAIQWYNTWSVPNIYYFDDEDPIPVRTTQGTVPKIRRYGESTYHVAEDWVEMTWTVTASSATDTSVPDSSIATVSSTGLVTFTQPGTVKVWLTMTDPSGASKSASKTVKYDSAPAYVVSADGNTKTAYGSLYAAFNAAQDGDKVVLGKDATVSNIGKIEIKDGRDLTFDLNGHTVSFSQNYREGAFGALFSIENGSLEVVDTGVTKGGIVASGNNARAFSLDGTDNDSANDAVLTIGEGVNVSSTLDCCVTVFGNCTLNTAGNLTSTNDFAIAGNGNAEYAGTVVNVTGGTITGDEIAIYQPQNGALNISGGTITGDTAVYVKAGTVSISGGTLVGNGAQADYSFNGSGANATGDALVVDNCGYTSSAPVVTITGGTFVSANGQSVSSHSKSDDPTYADSGYTAVSNMIPAVVNGEPNPARFGDAEADGVPEHYELVEVEGSDPVMYQVAAIPQFNIVWVVDGVSTTNVQYRDEATIVPANPEKADYIFTGWTPEVAATVTADATYTAQFDAVKATVFTIADAGATTNVIGTYTSLQAALDAAKENNLQQANIELLANASITISRNGNVLGGNSTTNITINGNNHELHVVRDGTWAQFNTANDATLVLNDVSLTSEFTGTATGWASEPLQNPNHNIAFNCVVTLKDVVSDNALSFWKDATLDTVTVSDSANVYPIWIHTTSDEISINNLTVNSTAVGRGIKVDDSYVSGWGGTPSATTKIDINDSTFNMDHVRKSAVLVGSAYPVVITESGNDITHVGADTENLVWVDERDSAAQNYGLVSVNGEQPGIEGGSSNFAASYSTNGTWIVGYYKVLADAVAIADADDTLTLQTIVTETFTVAKELTITLNGFRAENVTAGEGYTRTVTETTYVFAEAATGFNTGDENVGDFADPLTAEQAAWLNSYLGEGEGQYSKEQLAAATDLEKKYLLNVNPITGNGSLTVTGITVGGQVKVTVTLARTEGETAVGTREINGVLELWGTTGLGSSTPFAKLAAATISDADFSEGNTQEITFEGSAKFFKAYIVEPPAAVEP